MPTAWTPAADAADGDAARHWRAGSAVARHWWVRSAPGRTDRRRDVDRGRAAPGAAARAAADQRGDAAARHAAALPRRRHVAAGHPAAFPARPADVAAHAAAAPGRAVPVAVGHAAAGAATAAPDDTDRTPAVASAAAACHPCRSFPSRCYPGRGSRAGRWGSAGRNCCPEFPVRPELARAAAVSAIPVSSPGAVQVPAARAAAAAAVRSRAAALVSSVSAAGRQPRSYRPARGWSAAAARAAGAAVAPPAVRHSAAMRRVAAGAALVARGAAPASIAEWERVARYPPRTPGARQRTPAPRSLRGYGRWYAARGAGPWRARPRRRCG